MENSNRKLKALVTVLLVCMGAAFLAFDVVGVQLLEDDAAWTLLKGALTRFLGAAFAVAVIVMMRYDCLGLKGSTAKHLLLAAPLALVPLNNFPWLDSLSGRLNIDSTALLPLFALECLSVGVFEELIFRGFVFPMFLEKRQTDKKQLLFSVVASSAVFGLYHIVNLFAGSGPGAVALQVGYSFLLGMLLCVVLLLTKNIWLCALLHAVYNFGGLFYPTLGSGNLWSVQTVLLTVAVSLAVAAYAAWLFFKRDMPYATEIAPLRKQ